MHRMFPKTPIPSKLCLSEYREMCRCRCSLTVSFLLRDTRYGTGHMWRQRAHPTRKCFEHLSVVDGVSSLRRRRRRSEHSFSPFRLQHNQRSLFFFFFPYRFHLVHRHNAHSVCVCVRHYDLSGSFLIACKIWFYCWLVLDRMCAMAVWRRFAFFLVSRKLLQTLTHTQTHRPERCSIYAFNTELRRMLTRGRRLKTCDQRSACRQWHIGDGQRHGTHRRHNRVCACTRVLDILTRPSHN